MRLKVAAHARQQAIECLADELLATVDTADFFDLLEYSLLTVDEWAPACGVSWGKTLYSIDIPPLVRLDLCTVLGAIVALEAAEMVRVRGKEPPAHVVASIELAVLRGRQAAERLSLEYMPLAARMYSS